MKGIKRSIIAAVLLAMNTNVMQAEDAAPAVAPASPVQAGTVLLKRDFADGQVNMVIHNITPGAKAEVVDLDGGKAVKVTVPYALRQNRLQLQFFLDKNGIDPKAGSYYLVTFELKDSTPNGLNINPQLLPYWTGNELKAGEGAAKGVLALKGKPDAQGWSKHQYLYNFNNDTWDGYLLQFRLLFFRDGAVQDAVHEGFLRKMEMLQLTEEQATALKAKNEN